MAFNENFRNKDEKLNSLTKQNSLLFAHKRSHKYLLLTNCLEADTTLGLLFTTEFEVLAALVDKLVLSLARSAFKTNDSLLGSLGLLVEDGLGLTTITGLLTIVTAFTWEDD